MTTNEKVYELCFRTILNKQEDMDHLFVTSIFGDQFPFE